VPGIRLVDASAGVLGLEWIEGRSVRYLLGSGEEDEEEQPPVDAPVDGLLAEYGVSQDDLMKMVGAEIAKLHLADVIHGDLTTSNMMLQRPAASATGTATLFVIDFGLAYTSALAEDKAVDLYVLERAFASTHPDSTPLFASVLGAYEARLGDHWPPVKRKLDEVRLRGRKRSMVG